jgi:hypothetical protein
MTELTLNYDARFRLGLSWYEGLVCRRARGVFFLWLGIALIALFGVLEYRFPGRSNWRRRAGV